MTDLAWEKQTKRLMEKLAGNSFIDKESQKKKHKGISGTHDEFITMKRER